MEFPADEPAVARGARLASLADLDTLPPPDIARYPVVQVWVEAVRLLCAHFGNEVFIRGNCDQCPFALAALVRGMEGWLTDVMDPELQPLAHRLLDYCTEATSQFLRLMSATGAHMLSNGDSAAGPSVVSPRIYRRFALPYEQRIAALSHSLGFPYALHVCGNTKAILADLVTTGADALELDYKTDVRLAHDLMKDSTVFIGNLDPSSVVALGTPTLVEAKSRELIAVFGDTDRFILNAGCAIPATAPEANIRAMVRAARSWCVGSRARPSGHWASKTSCAAWAALDGAHTRVVAGGPFRSARRGRRPRRRKPIPRLKVPLCSPN